MLIFMQGSRNCIQSYFQRASCLQKVQKKSHTGIRYLRPYPLLLTALYIPLTITLSTIALPFGQSASFTSKVSSFESLIPEGLVRSMAWYSHGRDNNDLVDNLARNHLLKSPEIMKAMKSIDRFHFILPSGTSSRPGAYQDSPQPIGYGATISAPHMHAMCLELVKSRLVEGASVLDIGSGSGYLTAVMATMVGKTGKVVGIEHINELVEFSKKNIEHYPELKDRMKFIHGDGRLGWKENAPYDIIHVGAAAAEIPTPLKQQLRLPDLSTNKQGGVLVIPVGAEDSDQHLRLITRTGENHFDDRIITGVRYVPLTDSEYQRNHR